MKLNLGKHETQEVIFDRRLSNNGHIVIFGETGSGKTTEAVKLMLGMAGSGMTVLAFDVNNIFAEAQIHPFYRKAFFERLDVVEAYDDGIKIPLFKPAKFSDGTVEKAVDVIDGITDAFAKSFKFGVQQKAVLRSAVASASGKRYEKDGIAAIGTALDEFNAVKATEVHERIRQVTDHNCFVHGELFLRSGKINLIRLSKFSEDTQRVIVEILCSFLWKMAAKEKFQKEGLYLAIDECQNMDLGKNGIIGKMLVEGRKFNLNLLLSTQVMNKGDGITKLLTQASLLLHFRPARSEINTVAKLISPGNELPWRRLLLDLKKGEFVACGQFVCKNKLVSNPLIVSARIPEDIQ